MAFRDLIPKYNKKKESGGYVSKAERKVPGERVKVSSGNVEADFNKLLIQTALDHVTRRISQPTRDLYSGEVHAEMKDGSTDMQITVTLTHIKDKSEISGNVLVTRIKQNSGAAVAKATGVSLGEILVRELAAKHIRKYENVRSQTAKKLSQDYYQEDDGRTLDQIARDDRILELMKKPICPICGPASLDFPDWDECDHDY